MSVMIANSNTCSVSDEIYTGYWSEWLVNSIAPTIAGSKPSTVLTLTDTRIQPLLAMWRKIGRLMLAGTIIQFKTLYQSAEKETILFYRPDMLEECITNHHHKVFLQQMGYPVDCGLDECLEILKERFQRCCPHEVGILLGIPLTDVLGFMGLTDLPLTCRGEWCVYGDPEDSLAVMKRYADDRVHICSLITRGMSPYQILRGNWGELQYAI